MPDVNVDARRIRRREFFYGVKILMMMMESNYDDEEEKNPGYFRIIFCFLKIFLNYIKLKIFELFFFSTSFKSLSIKSSILTSKIPPTSQRTSFIITTTAVTERERRNS
jgi:hypothetical protein